MAGPAPAAHSTTGRDLGGTDLDPDGSPRATRMTGEAGAPWVSSELGRLAFQAGPIRGGDQATELWLEIGFLPGPTSPKPSFANAFFRDVARASFVRSPR